MLIAYANNQTEKTSHKITQTPMHKSHSTNPVTHSFFLFSSFNHSETWECVREVIKTTYSLTTEREYSLYLERSCVMLFKVSLIWAQNKSWIFGFGGRKCVIKQRRPMEDGLDFRASLLAISLSGEA